eukprot:scaffold3791_cov390-Prasinococcus_capsulatus_cf.AAC.7
MSRASRVCYPPPPLSRLRRDDECVGAPRPHSARAVTGGGPGRASRRAREGDTRGRGGTGDSRQSWGACLLLSGSPTSGLACLGLRGLQCRIGHAWLGPLYERDDAGADHSLWQRCGAPKSCEEARILWGTSAV